MIKNKAPVFFHFPQHTLDITTCRVMGIINVAPDSFCEASRCLTIDAALSMAEQMITDGAAIIDIGGEATQPALGSLSLSEEEECGRVVPVVKALCERFSLPISVDTSSPLVMQEAVAVGAAMINDVRALRKPNALEVAASLQVPVCLMHMAYLNGKDNEPEKNWAKDDMVASICDFLCQRRQACIDAGIARDNIMLDPGFGAGNFGKTTVQNLQMVKHLDKFAALGAPLLLGVSRKTAIGEVLQQPVPQRLAGSLALSVLAAESGVNIIRTHDVKPTVEALTMAAAVWQS